MRWVLLLMAGCYSPARGACEISCALPMDCPSGLTCNGTVCAPSNDLTCSNTPGIDGSTDVPGDLDITDAMPPCTAGKTFMTGPTLLPVDGLSFSVNNFGFALFQDQAGIRETSTANLTATQQINISNDMLSSPQMAAMVSGSEAFFRFTDGTVFKLMKSTRLGLGAWSNPAEVATSLILDSTFRPGQPTAIGPRRMMASTSAGLFEGIEQPNLSWTFDPLDVGVLNARDPNLSFDGLALAFIGNDSNGNVRVFVTTRPTLDMPFASPTPLTDNTGVISGTEQTPAFSFDCQTLFVSIDLTLVKFE